MVLLVLGQVEVAANFEAWNLTKEEMNLLTSQDQVLMDQFPMLNNINGASGLGNLDRWHWLDTPARYEDFLFFKIEFFKILCNCNLEANTPVKLRNDSHKMSTKCVIESSEKGVKPSRIYPLFFRFGSFTGMTTNV